MDLAEFYFRPKKWESSGLIYKKLGVLTFKKIATSLGKKTGQKSTKPNNYYIWQKDFEGIKKYERKTRYNELMHLAGMILPLLGLLNGGNNLTTQIVLWVVLLINIHPFFLQRYNRIRIYRLLKNEKQLPI